MVTREEEKNSSTKGTTELSKYMYFISEAKTVISPMSVHVLVTNKSNYEKTEITQ